MPATATKSVHRELYISSGMKNGFYTLRTHTRSGRYCADSYLRNLSTDADKAERLAREYFDRVYGPDCEDVVFLGYADFDLNPWGTSLQPWERAQVAEIEAGFWPFGKHKGATIKDSPDGYLMFWASKAADTQVMAALVEVCRSIADERGLVAKYEERKRKIAEQVAKDALVSKHVGTVGERRDLSLTVRGMFQYDGVYGTTYGYIMADVDGNVVVGKFTTKLAGVERDTQVAMKATVKAHTERDGVKQTIVNRPKLLG